MGNISRNLRSIARRFRTHSCQRPLADFVRDGKGSVVVMFGLTSMLIVTVSGAAIDYALALNFRSELQNSLDAAVLGAAVLETDDKVAEASTIFDVNYSRKHVGSVASRFLDADNIVSGSATVEVNTNFLSIFGISEIKVSADSAAAYSSVQTCIYVLDQSAGNAFKANGSGEVDAPECEMHVHSSSNTAAYLDSKKIEPLRLCVRGKIAGNARPFADNFDENCDVSDDPYADTMASVSDGVVSEQSCTTNFPDPNKSEMVFQPGTYCSWPPINGHVTSVVFEEGDYYIKSSLSMNAKAMTFGDGTYVFDGANLTFNGSAKTVSLGEGLYVLKNGAQMIFNGQEVSGSNVSIHLADEDSAFLTVQGSSEVNLDAPDNGTYKDLLIFETPGLQSSNSQYKLDGEMNIEGLVYLPSRNLHFNGSGEVNGDELTLVLNQLSLDGDITIESGSGSGGGSYNAYLLR
ncbi:TadE/TadG family type IV pilus assembly protein [uncultured Roseibium sp.]|uniref:TadE/TadG family type IV pilus assembly protein n=1 Tax=uncultured Roseibium sp. TaxID=1936171 RepID=UPI002592695C|nr:TadE/TadG family type IV pilus assembly protein [uncultured Roseibium sp.]